MKVFILLIATTICVAPCRLYPRCVPHPKTQFADKTTDISGSTDLVLSPAEFMFSKPRKRSKALETVAFSLELLRRIPRRRLITASELQEQLSQAGFERDLRTVQRQLESLSEHFDIERDDRSKPYGYRWKEKAVGLALPMLSSQEALLLSLAEQQLRPLLPAKLMDSMDGFFAEAKSMLAPHASAKREREWLAKVRVVSVTQPMLPPQIRPRVFEEVSEALYADCWLDVNYQNVHGKQTDARVMPLGLAQQGPRLYLICRFDGYSDDRSLALHRIGSAKSTGLTFERPRDFSLQQYDDDGRFGLGNGQRIRLSFQIGKVVGQHIVESPLSSDQVVSQKGEQLEIVATVQDSPQLDWWLRSFGAAVSDIKKVAV